MINLIPIAKSLLRTGQQAAVKHLPGILMGMGTGCVTGSVILAMNNGQRAAMLLDNASRDKADVINAEKEKEGKPFRKVLLAELTPKEKLQATWKLYIPPVGLLLIGIGCFWSGHFVDLRRQAVLAGLYSTAEASLAEYQKKVAELFGQQGADRVRESIGQDHVDQTRPPENAYLMQPGADTWCEIDKQAFRSSYVEIKKVENDANHQMFRDMYISKQELYWMLDPSGRYLRATEEDKQIYYDVDKLIELRITPTIGPNYEQVLHVDILDSDGLEYRPKVKFGMLH